MTRRQRDSRLERARAASARRAIIAGGGVAVAATLLSGASAGASGKPRTVVVDSLGGGPAASNAATTVQPSGQETLADAIELLDHGGKGGKITFASKLSGHTIDLLTALPSISAPIAIDGPGFKRLAIDGGSDNLTPFKHTIFTIDSGVSGTTRISGLTLEHGNATGEDGDDYSGGAVHAESAVALSGDVLSFNYARDDGGTVFAGGEPLRISGSIINFSSAGDKGSGIGGGAVADQSTGHPKVGLTVYGSVFEGDGAEGEAATVSSSNVPVTIEDSTAFWDTGGVGGSAVNLIGSAPLKLVGDTFYYNDSAAGGDTGGGVSTWDDSRPITIESSIIADNGVSGSPGGPVDLDFAGTPGTKHPPVRIEFSLIGDSTDGAASGEDLTGMTKPLIAKLPFNRTDKRGSYTKPLMPILGVLTDWGAADFFIPAAGSPVLDAGRRFGLRHDGRGGRRTVNISYVKNAKGGDGTDIGAIEAHPTQTVRARVRGEILTLTTPSQDWVEGAGPHERPLRVSVRSTTAKHGRRSKSRKLTVRSVTLSVATGSPSAVLGTPVTVRRKARVRRTLSLSALPASSSSTYGPAYGPESALEPGDHTAVVSAVVTCSYTTGSGSHRKTHTVERTLRTTIRVENYSKT